MVKEEKGSARGWPPLAYVVPCTVRPPQDLISFPQSSWEVDVFIISILQMETLMLGQ